MQLNILGIDFGSFTPAGNNNATVYYKSSSSNIYIGGDDVIVLPNGSFVTPLVYTISPIADTYNIKVQLACETIFIKNITVSPPAPTIILGTIRIVGSNAIVTLEQFLNCAVSFSVNGQYNSGLSNGSFSGNIDLPAHVTTYNANPAPAGATISCLQASSDGINIIRNVVCLGITYTLTLQIIGPLC